MIRKSAHTDPSAGCYIYPRTEMKIETLADYVEKVQQEERTFSNKKTFNEWWSGEGCFGFPLDEGDRRAQFERCWQDAQANK